MGYDSIQNNGARIRGQNKTMNNIRFINDEVSEWEIRHVNSKDITTGRFVLLFKECSQLVQNELVVLCNTKRIYMHGPFTISIRRYREAEKAWDSVDILLPSAAGDHIITITIRNVNDKLVFK